MRISLRRVLLLVSVAILLAAGMWCIHYQRQETNRRAVLAWKATGLKANQSGDPVTAVDYLSRYLRQYPDDAEALETYAQARPRVNTGDERQAIQETIFALRQLLILQPNRNDVREQLLEAYIQAGDANNAVETADALLADKPGDVHVLELKASALMGAQDWPRAKAVLAQWLAAAPLDVEPHFAMLSVLQQMRTPLAKIVRRAMDLRLAHPGDGRFELVEAVALRLTGLASEPADAAHPDHPRDGRSAVEWLRAAAASDQPTADARFTAALVLQLDQVGLFDDSLAVLRRAAATSNDASFRHDLACRLWEDAKWDQAVPLLKAAENEDAKWSNQALAMEGFAMLRLGRSDEVNRIHDLLSHRANDPLAAGWCAILERLIQPQIGNPKAWVESCRAALAYDSTNPYLRFYLAEAYAQLGENDLAITLLEDVTRRDLTWALAPATLAELLVSSNRPKAAAQAAEEAERRAASNGKLHDIGIALILARAWDAQLRNSGDGDAQMMHDLQTTLAAVQKALPQEEQTLAIQIDLLARTGDRAGAIQRLDQALHDSSPLNESAWLRLAAVSHERKLGRDEACLDRSQRDHGLTANLAYARAVLLFEQGQGATGLTNLESARQQSGHAYALSWRVAYARYLDLIGDASARAQWEELADQQAGNLPVQQFALAAASTRADRPFIQRTIGRLRDLTGDQGVLWRLAQARWVLDDPTLPISRLAEASSLLNGVMRIAPESPQAHWLLGRALRQLKNTAAAAEHLETAASLDPSSASIALDLAQVLQERGQTSLARKTLNALALTSHATPELLLALGHLDEQSGDSAAAEASYRHCLELSPSNPAAGNALARLLIHNDDRQQTSEALALAVAATQAAPQTPDYFDTLAQAQAKSGNLDQALQSIAQAISLPGSTLSHRLEQIRWMLDAGRRDEVRKAFDAIDTRNITDWSLRGDLDSLRKRLGAGATRQAK